MENKRRQVSSQSASSGFIALQVPASHITEIYVVDTTYCLVRLSSKLNECKAGIGANVQSSPSI